MGGGDVVLEAPVLDGRSGLLDGLYLGHSAHLLGHIHTLSVGHQVGHQLGHMTTHLDNITRLDFINKE